MEAYPLVPKLEEILDRLDAIEDSLDEIKRALDLPVEAIEDQEVYVCSHCGKDIDAADKYCAGCGRSLEN